MTEQPWMPRCMGETNATGAKWRVLTDGTWFHIECKAPDADQWEAGLSGTREWLGLTEDEAARAYPKKKGK